MTQLSPDRPIKRLMIMYSSIYIFIDTHLSIMVNAILNNLMIFDGVCKEILSAKSIKR